MPPSVASTPVSLPRICVSSAHGSGGKTLLSLGLGRKLRERGLAVKAFKKGPDYIDAAWLSQACGSPASNLDLYFASPPDIVRLFIESAKGFDFALIEGNRGLYDGADVNGSYSTAELARTLTAPILLCVDCAKTARTMAAVLKGLIGFEDGLTFCGVVLNRVASARHEAALIQSIEASCPLKILGVLPRSDALFLPERHMGLTRRGDRREEAEAFIERAARLIGENCDLDGVIADASATPPVVVPEEIERPDQPRERVAIGYVRDAAFWFYYQENLAALERSGAELIPLSLLDDSPDWDNISGLYMGGGFPEDFAEEIAVSPRLATLRRFAAEGMPVYAECGGLIALCESLEKDGKSYDMAGVFPERIVWRPRPQGLGYIQGQVAAENPFFPKGLILRGHEFHYSARQGGAELTAAGLTLARGMGLVAIDGKNFDGLIKNNVWAAFAHIFAPAVPCWARNFVAAAREYRDRRQ